MTGFLKVPCQPSMADPHLRPKGLLRDRRAGAQSHVRGYRSSCGPHLASSGAAAASASLPTRSGMRAISAAVAVLASRGTGPRETSSLRRPRSLPEQARACPEIARDTGVPPSLRHAGLSRARTQAPSMRGLRTSAQPFPGMRPSPRLSAPGPPRGRETEVGRGPSRARACQRAAPGRRPWRPPRPWPPARRRRPRPTRRPREPRGSPPRPGIAQADGARPVPEVPAPAPLGPAGRRAPVPRHAVSAQGRTRALARRLADAGQVAGIRAGTNPVQPLSHTPWDGCGKPAIHSAISPWSFPLNVRVPGSPSSGAGAHIVVAHGWPPIPKYAR